MNSELIAHAIKTAETLGAPVFPVRVEPDPEHSGKTLKRPLVRGWQNGAAATDPEAIKQLFSQHPRATHVGVQTGERSRILVIDLDGEPGLQWWRDNTDLLPPTRTQRTQREHGKHLLYRVPPGCSLRNSAGKIAPGVDIRAGGGFVVDWSAIYPPEVEDVTDAPLALIEFLQKTSATPTITTPTQSAVGIPEGKRNVELTRLAGRLRHLGLDATELEAALVAVNARRCIIALQEDEVRQIAQSVARYESDAGSAQLWIPPAVTSYGPTFDPAAIPLRQWLIPGRYALGEGTAIAGPPGTNKSTLLLTDAVQLVTGRSLVGDSIDRSGGVLFLVGEDRRRDFEARLAGICEHYRIAPGELGGRLHVVYQSEINPTDFTLGQMADDMATLNIDMFDWLRAFPDLVALFIDPMLSWHRLIENENAAMQMLCVGLRGLATQANIAVAFDHHVSKVSMADAEAHVGNLAAMRGASAIAADMRWAFTMAKLKAETATQYGLTLDDRKIYRRLDTLKASYGPDDDGPRLLKIESVRILNGEHVGVLTAVDADRLRADGRERAHQAEQERRTRLGDALARMLREKRPRSSKEAAMWLAVHDPHLFPGKKGAPLSERSIRDRLPTEIGAGIDSVSDGRPVRVIVREAGSGHGMRYEIDFAQRALTPVAE